MYLFPRKVLLCAFIYFWGNILPYALIPYCVFIRYSRVHTGIPSNQTTYYYSKYVVALMEKRYFIVLVLFSQLLHLYSISIITNTKPKSIFFSYLLDIISNQYHFSNFRLILTTECQPFSAFWF